MNVKQLRSQIPGLTQKQLAESTGIPIGRIGKWEEGKGSPKTEDFITLSKFFGSKGITISEDVRNDSIDTESYITKRRNKKNEDSPYLVPFVDLPAQAGYRNAYSDIDYILTLKKYPILPNVDPTGTTWRYFEIDGDSMEPVLTAGDSVLTSLVIKEDWIDIRDYYTYVIVTHSELLIKDVFKGSSTEWVLLSQNPDYGPRLLNIQDVRQLWVVRRHVKNRLPKHRMYDTNEIKKLLKNK